LRFQLTIRTRSDNDDVLRCRVHGDECCSGQSSLAGRNAFDVDAFVAQPVAIGPSIIIRANASDHRDRGALTRGGHRLVCALAAKALDQAGRCDRFTGCRQMFNGSDVIDVQ